MQDPQRQADPPNPTPKGSVEVMSGSRTDDLDLTRSEFSLQADAMARGATFNAHGAIDPFVRLLGTPIPSPLLDLACGPGIISGALAHAGAEVVGVDATAAMLERARELTRNAGVHTATFQEADANRLPFDDAVFSGAVTRLSLHHFVEPARALDELRRVLCTGAPLVLGDIIASLDPAEARLHNALERLRDPSHQRLLCHDELTRRVEAAGFRLQAIEPWSNPKTFDEWAAVVGAARSIEPLREVMRALANAGQRAGIELRADGNAVCFTHRWLFVQAFAV